MAMLQPTGSVYLDAPRPSRRTLPDTPSGPRVAIAGVLAALGLISLTIAAGLGILRVLVHDPDTVNTAVDAALDDPTVRAELEFEIAQAIETSLFGEQLVAALGIYGIDVAADAERVAPIILDDPAFRAALSDLVDDTHQQLLESGPTILDLSSLTDSVRDVIVTEVPEAAAALPASASLSAVRLEGIPDLSGPVSLLDRAALAVAAGGFLLPIAALIHPRRHRIVAWIGRWMLCMGLAAGLLAVGLPYAGGRITGYSVVEITIRELSVRLLAPAAIAGIIGMGLVSVASILRSRERFATADEGVAAALGYDEPDLFDLSTSPQMDLAQRGLVDVSHPLTNI